MTSAAAVAENRLFFFFEAVGCQLRSAVCENNNKKKTENEQEKESDEVCAYV
jgi:hypothetical protein